MGRTRMAGLVAGLVQAAARHVGAAIAVRTAVQRAAEEVGKAAFDAICSAQKGSSTRRLEPYLSLPYLTLPSEGADAGAIACTSRV